MALKALMIRKKITEATAKLEELRSKSEEYQKREAELEAAVKEAVTDEETDTAEAEAEKFDAEKAEHESNIAELEEEVRKLEEELAEIERSAKPIVEKRKETKVMENIRYRSMSMEQRSAFVERDEVKEFLTRARNLSRETRGVTGGDLLIPITVLDLIRREVAEQSKLIPHVRLVNVAGEARQNVAGAIPEGVWTEMCANLNELPITFNQIAVDGYKVGGYIAICNATLEDADIDLAGEIISSLGGAIAKALDNAILFGTGTKMPIGIATRLAQTSQPAYWESTAPAWTDLHTSNIQTLNIDSSSGAAFFEALIEKLAIAKDFYHQGGLFWVMNRKTHLHVMAKALAFDAAAALRSNTELFPIIGGTIVEMDDDRIADNEIIGGFGGNYLLAQRATAKFAYSDAPLFVADQTVFKGTARYDGKPIAGEAFVIVNFNNTAPTTSKTFPVDYANTDMNDLIVTAAAGTASGDTVLTVTGAIGSTPVLKYKLGNIIGNLNVGDTATGFTALTSGTTQITAAAGKHITVVELDGNNRIVSSGIVVSVPKA